MSRIKWRVAQLGLSVLLSLAIAGCASRPTIADLGTLARGNDGQSVRIKGYFWPGYEGSVVCEAHDFHTCLEVVMFDGERNRFHSFRKGDRVTVIGRFRWMDLEAYKPKYDSATESVGVQQCCFHHRIEHVESIEFAD